MNYQKFIQQLPHLYANWGQASLHPKSDVFQSVLEQVSGKTTANVMQLLNFAVECMESDEIYCEIGCFQGATLIGALLNNSAIAYAVDNFSELDIDGENLKQLTKNLEAFELDEQVFFCNQDFEEFFGELKELQVEQKIGVYFYNSAHDYRSQLLGLLLVKPFLAEKALIIIDDSNYSEVQQANWDFMAAHRECQLLLDLPTPKDGYNTFWNGLQVFSWDVNQQSDYNWSEFSENYRHQPLIKALSDFHLEFEFKQKPDKLVVLEQEALAFHSRQELIEAESKYKEILIWDKSHTIAYHNLGMIYYQQERYPEALALVQKSVEINSQISEHHYSLGLVLEKLGNISQAISAYQQAIAINPQFMASYQNLGNILYTAGQLEQAISVYRQAIAVNPEDFNIHFNLGNILLVNCQIEEAITTYKTAMKLQPDNNDFLYLNIGNCYERLHQYQEAIEVYKQGIKHYPNVVNLYLQLAAMLIECGNTQAAIEVYEKALLLFPNNLDLKIKSYLMLPIIYKSQEEIYFYRHRFTQGLEKLIEQINLDTPEVKQQALKAIGKHTNFYISYQGFNNKELQKQYGQLVHQIMAANYPQWMETPSMPPLKKDNKIRIGYVSSCLFRHAVGNLSVGWICNHNKTKFEIYCYQIHNVQDRVTEIFNQNSDVFRYIPDNLEAVSQQIIADKLHILVFIDIGMHPQMTQLASMRLAPIQCTTWCHPETSGLSTVDYFLSSDLMEPENARSHYSEKLICLPNIGVSYPQPNVPEKTKNRADFQIQDNAIVYLCCQHLTKYLPQYDYIFAAIAQQIPQAKFLFISRPHSFVAEQLRQRLQLAFAEFHLNIEEHCIFLKSQDKNNYWNLNLIADVFLDSFLWSGGHTTLEAIACNLPVVTCPGEFMRGRHSYGILKMLGVTETIAASEAEYIEIAVRLGLDKEWRQSIVEKIKRNHHRLYDDKTCVQALENFYQNLVMDAQRAINGN